MIKRRNRSKNLLTKSHMGKLIYLKDDGCIGNPNPKENRIALVTIDNGVHIGINSLYSYKGNNKKERYFLKHLDKVPIFTKETGVHWKIHLINLNSGKMFRITDDFITETGYQLTKIKMIEIHKFIERQTRFNKEFDKIKKANK
jgi:hypothetical protein